MLGTSLIIIISFGRLNIQFLIEKWCILTAHATCRSSGSDITANVAPVNSTSYTYAVCQPPTAHPKVNYIEFNTTQFASSSILYIDVM